jgi:hypothetical protein
MEPEGDAWDTLYEQVLSFGNLNKRIPNGSCRNEAKLSHWCDKQIKNMQKGKLTLKQIKQIEKIPSWSWNITNTYGMWNSWYYQAKEFAETYNREPDPDSEDKIEKKLGRWCERQKVLTRNDRYLFLCDLKNYLNGHGILI